MVRDGASGVTTEDRDRGAACIEPQVRAEPTDIADFVHGRPERHRSRRPERDPGRKPVRTSRVDRDPAAGPLGEILDDLAHRRVLIVEGDGRGWINRSWSIAFMSAAARDWRAGTLP